MFLLITMCMLSVGCAVVDELIHPNEEIEGVLVDDDTGEPIAGAFVGLWLVIMVSDWPHTFSERPNCYWSTLGVTDEQGRFRFPPVNSEAWGRLQLQSRDLYLSAYAQGYVYDGPIRAFSLGPGAQKVDAKGNFMRMSRDKRSGSVRLAYLGSHAMAVDCASRANIGEPVYVDLHRTIYEEAARLATTNADRIEVVGICKEAMGYDPLRETYYPELFPEPCTFDAERFNRYRETDAREQRVKRAMEKVVDEWERRRPAAER